MTRKITSDDLNSLIEKSIKQYYRFTGTNVTVCCLTLPNGFNLIGYSACIYDQDFNREVGQQEALINAQDQLLKLELYRIKNTMYEQTRFKMNKESVAPNKSGESFSGKFTLDGIPLQDPAQHFEVQPDGNVTEVDPN